MIDEVVKVIEDEGKAFVRFISFVCVWNTFWSSVKEHFFLFEDRKVAIVYFYNTETTDFIGPLYDAGPRFKRDDCKKRYSVFLKAAVCQANRFATIPYSSTHVSHMKNRHNFVTVCCNYDINIV